MGTYTELLYEYRISVWEVKKVLETDDGDSCTAV